MLLQPSISVDDTPSPPSYGRRYSTETFDRHTGELIALDLGVWTTLTEFTTLMGVSMRIGRLILEEIGLVHIEGRRYRLKSEHEQDGLGKRLTTKTSRFPFDVLSPAGQSYARDRWAEAEARVRLRRKVSPKARAAAAAFEAFRSQRDGVLTTQMSVCWFLDFFPDLSTRDIAMMLGVTESIVFKWSARRNAQRQRASDLKLREFDDVSPEGKHGVCGVDT